MKNYLLLTLFAISSFMMVSCDEDNDMDNGVIISGLPITAEIESGGTYGPVNVTIEAEDGLSRLVVTKDGASFDNQTLSGKSATVPFSYTAVPADDDKNVVFTFTATDEDGDSESVSLVISVGASVGEVLVNANVSENTTWTADKTYILGGRITVLDGVTLTIEPGTVIKGQAGTGANATALLIARGGKLMAEGTAQLPIVFTSVADEITGLDIAAGNYGSPNLEADVNGLWGGVIVLGKAPISASNTNGDVSEVQIEGIPTSDPNGLYGGNISDDNSGVIKYISIRHGGTNIGSGNEINGLTLGGVGSGTVIENIEIVANQDDGVEWFGGTVNVKNVVVLNCGDDGIDTDQSWDGTLDNFVVIAPTGHCFELDGPEGSYEAGHTITNGTIYATYDGRTSADLINVDANSIVDLSNLYFTDVVDGQKINRVTAAGVTFTNIEINVNPADLGNYVNGTVPAGVSATSNPTVGADLNVFGWTWAKSAGIF